MTADNTYDLHEPREIAAIYPHRFFIKLLGGATASGFDRVQYLMLDARDPKETYFQLSIEDFVAITGAHKSAALDLIAAALGGDRVGAGDIPSIADRIDDLAAAVAELADMRVDYVTSPDATTPDPKSEPS